MSKPRLTSTARTILRARIRAHADAAAVAQRERMAADVASLSVADLLQLGEDRPSLGKLHRFDQARHVRQRLRPQRREPGHTVERLEEPGLARVVPGHGRSHANILNRDGEYYIVDTNSTNHTYVNGVMIRSNVETKLTHGAKITLANESFEFLTY